MLQHSNLLRQAHSTFVVSKTCAAILAIATSIPNSYAFWTIIAGVATSTWPITRIISNDSFANKCTTTTAIAAVLLKQDKFSNASIYLHNAACLWSNTRTGANDSRSSFTAWHIPTRRTSDTCPTLNPIWICASTNATSTLAARRSRYQGCLHHFL